MSYGRLVSGQASDGLYDYTMDPDNRLGNAGLLDNAYWNNPSDTEVRSTVHPGAKWRKPVAMWSRSPEEKILIVAAIFAVSYILFTSKK